MTVRVLEKAFSGEYFLYPRFDIYCVRLYDWGIVAACSKLINIFSTNAEAICLRQINPYNFSATFAQSRDPELTAITPELPSYTEFR